MSKKGENIYKRKDGRWEARYIKGYSPDGAARYGYCYGKTYYAAKDKVNRARAAVIDPETVSENGKRRRMTAYCDEWLRLRRSKVKESTYVKYETVLERHIKPELGGLFIQSLSSSVLEQFGYNLLHRDGLSPKTVRDILGQLHSVLKYIAKQTHYLPRIEIIYPKTEKREMRVLSRAEQERLVTFLLTDTDKCKFGTLLALLTGPRIGEICALKWENIILESGILKVSGTMQRIKNLADRDGGKTHIIISDPKSFSSARIIPLSAYTADLCKGFFIDNGKAYVLTGSPNRYIEPRIMQYRMEQYCRECGLEGVHFHSLRHSFATRCVEVGFDIKSLSEILGHASPQITLERYVHSSIELKRENMNKLSAIGY